jgi:curved DNA-binding protein
MEYRDYYKTLGVQKTATQAEIKKAYRRLARELHPDRNPGDKAAERRFKEVNEAHAVLADPAKRRQYDMLGANWAQYASGGAGGQPFAGDPFGPGGPFAGFGGAAGQQGNIRYEFHTADSGGFSDFFRMFFGGGLGGFGGATDEGRRSGRRGAGSLDDLFATYRSTRAGDAGSSGASGGAGRGSTGRGSDVQANVDLSLEEAFHGTARLVQVGDRRLEVKVPAGVDTGSKIRLRGRAGSGSGAGDLYLVTRIRPHPVFSRNGADLTRDLPVTLQEALLGGEVSVETLRGRVLLKVPPGTQNGQTFRLKGQGMPRLKGEGAGDLYARIKVVLPEKLDGEQRRAAEELLRQIDQPNPRKN